MGLREIAELDLGVTLEGVDAWDIEVSDPDGHFIPMRGTSTDIAQVIDPDTGQTVSGRFASVTLRLSTLRTAGFKVPQGIADASLKPWLVKFLDIVGEEHTFKVVRTSPDRTLGMVVCAIERYVEK